MFDLQKALDELSRLNAFIADIRREVQLYEQLYCCEQSRLAMKGKLESVFSIIQRSMFTSILTRVSATLDSKSFGRDHNLCLAFVEDKYRSYLKPETLTKFEGVNSKFAELNIKHFRNKLVAHNDLASVFSHDPVSHCIKEGDIDGLLVDARSFCISVCNDLPGGIEAVLNVVPWRLRPGGDGAELMRRVATASVIS